MKKPVSPTGFEVDGHCGECGAPYYATRPGSGAPTCDCHLICPLHTDTKYEYVVDTDAKMGGWVCPECAKWGK